MSPHCKVGSGWKPLIWNMLEGLHVLDTILGSKDAEMIKNQLLKTHI